MARRVAHFAVGYKHDNQTDPFAWFTSIRDAEHFLEMENEANDLEMWEL